jgi:hypothetical protein
MVNRTLLGTAAGKDLPGLSGHLAVLAAPASDEKEITI